LLESTFNLIDINEWDDLVINPLRYIDLVPEYEPRILSTNPAQYSCVINVYSQIIISDLSLYGPTANQNLSLLWKELVITIRKIALLYQTDHYQKFIERLDNSYWLEEYFKELS
jgi:hypothetical protein